MRVRESYLDFKKTAKTKFIIRITGWKKNKFTDLRIVELKCMGENWGK